MHQKVFNKFRRDPDKHSQNVAKLNFLATAGKFRLDICRNYMYSFLREIYWHLMLILSEKSFISGRRWHTTVTNFTAEYSSFGAT